MFDRFSHELLVQSHFVRINFWLAFLRPNFLNQIIVRLVRSLPIGESVGEKRNVGKHIAGSLAEDGFAEDKLTDESISSLCL